MAKIDSIQPLKIQEPKEVNKQLEKSPAKATGKSFKDEIQVSLAKMEVLTDKIRGNISPNNNEKLNTNDIINDVHKARVILDELTNTFSGPNEVKKGETHQIDQKSKENQNSQENKKYQKSVNASQGLDSYAKANNNLDKHITKDRKVT
ncbi:MAG: hypothetical protein JJV97_05890 [SAR324 cluster bacterium]|nr:hypothetical protein [SAR324 cluster bacterium]